MLKQTDPIPATEVGERQPPATIKQKPPDPDKFKPFNFSGNTPESPIWNSA